MEPAKLYVIVGAALLLAGGAAAAALTRLFCGVFEALSLCCIAAKDFSLAIRLRFPAMWLNVFSSAID